MIINDEKMLIYSESFILGENTDFATEDQLLDALEANKKAYGKMVQKAKADPSVKEKFHNKIKKNYDLCNDYLKDKNYSAILKNMKVSGKNMAKMCGWMMLINPIIVGLVYMVLTEKVCNSKTGERVAKEYVALLKKSMDQTK